MWRTALLLTLLAALAGPAVAAARPPERTGRLLVTLRGPASTAPSTAAAVAAAAGARRAGRGVPQIGLLAVRPAGGDSLAALRARLRRDPRVAGVEAETRARPRAPADDPALVAPEATAGTAPGTALQWWAGRSDFPQAWELSRGDRALVAVVDTGIDASHPDLADRIAAAQSFEETPGSPAVDGFGHGTHVASVACGAGDNAVGLAGAGLRCRILNAKTDFSDASVAAALVWAADEGADVVNMSFGSPPGVEPSAALRRALDYAVQRDVVLVAAAADEPIEDQGHPAKVLQPAGSAADLGRGSGLAVTAATFSDRRAVFAGFGGQISLAAYGAYEEQAGPQGIFGAFPAGETLLEQGGWAPGKTPCACRTTLAGDRRYAYLEGTSMATAMVSGAAALVRSLNPDLPAADVVRLLKEHARRAPGTGWGPELGWGILDAAAPLRAARTIDRRPPRSRVDDLPARRPAGTLTLRWTGGDRSLQGVARSGVRAYDVYRGVDGGRLRRVARTRRTSRRFRLLPGHRYAFATAAVDRAGNRETLPARPDQTVVVPAASGR